MWLWSDGSLLLPGSEVGGGCAGLEPFLDSDLQDVVLEIWTEVIPLRWWHRTFPPQSHSKEDQLAMIHRWDTTVKFPEPMGEVKPPIGQQKIRRIRGAAIPSLHRLLQAITVPLWEGRPGPMISPVGKESPKWTSSFPSIVRHFPRGHSGLTSWKSLEGSVELDFQESDWDRVGGKTYSTSTLILVDSIPACSGPKEGSQLVTLPIFRAELVVPSGQGDLLAILSDWVPNQRVPAVELILPSFPGREENSKSCPTAEYSLQSCQSRKVTGYKTNIQKAVAFLYTKNKLSEK